MLKLIFKVTYFFCGLLAATGMKWIEVKMRELGVTNNPSYKITFFIDSLAMITVHTQKYGTVNVCIFNVVSKSFVCLTHVMHR